MRSPPHLTRSLTNYRRTLLQARTSWLRLRGRKVRLAMDTLAARVIEIRPAYIGKASSAEIGNFAEFIDSLAVLARHIERPLDEPPRPPTTDRSNSAVPRNKF